MNFEYLRPVFTGIQSFVKLKLKNTKGKKIIEQLLLHPFYVKIRMKKKYYKGIFQV